jgi:hypothetical protein
MTKTTEYFKMKENELLELRNEYGYTREDCKIFDEGLKVTFFDNVNQYEQGIEEEKQWTKNYNPDLEIKTELLTVGERVAVIYH